jgi:glycosyltransferase involved in cell wall biosynthesis
VYYDIDDAVMYQRRKIGRISQWLKHRRYLATAGIMDHVVAGNENLAGMFRDLGCKVTMLPTVVDPNHYQVKTHAATDQPTMVWIGSRSTLPYLRQWMPAMESAARRVPGLRLLTIANDTVQSDVLKVEHIPWSLETEAAALARGDIGIAPTPVDPWTLGKCGFKIIQYMATSLPAIASPVGMNGDIIKSGETGLLPASIEDWPEAIAKLASDVQLRSRMGAAGRAVVEKDFSLTKARAVWAAILNS